MRGRKTRVESSRARLIRSEASARRGELESVRVTCDKGDFTESGGGIQEVRARRKAQTGHRLYILRSLRITNRKTGVKPGTWDAPQSFFRHSRRHSFPPGRSL